MFNFFNFVEDAFDKKTAKKMKITMITTRVIADVLTGGWFEVSLALTEREIKNILGGDL